MSNSTRPLLAYWDEAFFTATIRFTFAVIGFSTNTFLLFIILTTKKLRSCQSNCYIALLAVADLVIAIGLFIRASYQVYANTMGIIQFQKVTCGMVNCPMGMGFTMTRVAVLAIAADRLCMTLRPLVYKSKFNLPVFLFVLSLMILFTTLDTFTKLYAIDNSQLIPLCSMGAIQAPLSSWFGQIYSNSCLALLFAMYIPFLVLYFRINCSHSGIASSLNWRRQLEVTGTIVWLVMLYAFLWGGSYGLLLIDQFVPLANGSSASSYITYIFGFASSTCSSSAFIVYLVKHEEIRRQTLMFFKRNKLWNNVIEITPVVISLNIHQKH